MPNRKRITFTKHAFDRVGERLKLTPKEIAKVIDDGKYVLIGKEKNRVHKLFYSRIDNQCFVAVHDDRDHLNEIITVLPLDYHHRWEISESVVYDAKKLSLENTEIYKSDDSLADSITELTEEISGANVRIRFTCYFQNGRNGSVRIGNFTLKIPVVELEEYLSQFNSKSKASKELLTDLIKKQIPNDVWENNLLQSAYYQIGKNGALTEFFLQ